MELVNEGVVILLGGVGVVEVGCCSVAFKMCKISPRLVTFLL